MHISRVHKENGVPMASVDAADPVSNTNDGGLHKLQLLKKNVRVLKHIPKGARNLAAGKLSSLIEACVRNNEVDEWFALLSFSYTALKLPERSDSDKGTSLTTKVKQNIDECNLYFPPDTNQKPRSIHRTIETKVHDGDLRGAVRILLSDSSLASSNSDTLKALQDKHPSPSRQLAIPPEPDLSSAFLSVSVADVTNAIGSFYSGSASGLDGLRPQHLKELTSSSAGNNGTKLLESLCKLCNFLLRGMLNPQVCPYLYGATLCALEKKDGGIRPIAIGNTIRRLVAKLGCRSVREEMAMYLQPCQIGFGTPLGCEAAIHATRHFAMAHQGTDTVIVKLDIKNAFNRVERDVILTQVKDHLPALYPFLYQCYSSPSHLFYDDSALASQVGAQQGDPLGPLVFCLAIQNAITILDSPLNVWYLDDGTIGGPADVVLGDINRLLPALQSIGLEINPSKCEIYHCDPVSARYASSFQSVLPGIKVIAESTFSLLGAPIFSEGVSSALQAKIIALKSSLGHLKHLSAHVALILLRNCFTMPRVTYILRTAPTWMFKQDIEAFDRVLQQGLEAVLNVSFNKAQWLQATLPVRYGGLGVRCANDIGLVAFLASSHASSDLVTNILDFNGDNISIPFAQEALTEWSVRSSSAQQPDHPASQRLWDDVLCKKTHTELLNGASGANVARLKAVAEPESGAWLHALPSPHLGTLLDNDTLRVAVALRIGSKVCEPHRCLCGVMVETDGHHGLSCMRCAGRIPRHFAINEIIRRAMVSANVPCILEPQGLSRSDGKRPDGLTLVPWEKGRSLLWDATCVSTYAPTHLAQTNRVAGAAAENAARHKHVKYADLEPVYDFVPVAVETAGPWCAEAKKLVKDIGRRLRDRGCDPRSGSYLVQQISLAIQRGNAAGVFGTFGPGESRIGY